MTNKINFDIAFEEFANKTAKVTVQKIVVFISEIKMVLIFYTFFTIFPYRLCHFCFLFNYNVSVFGVYLKHTIFVHVRESTVIL